MLDYRMMRRGGECAAAEWQRYTAECRVRALEASLSRIDMDDFELTMSALKAAQQEQEKAAQEVFRLRCKAWEADLAELYPRK